LQFGGSVLDHGENLGSETPDQLLREDRPDAFEQATAEVPFDPLGCGRRAGVPTIGDFRPTKNASTRQMC